MDRYQQKLERLNKVITKHNLGYIYDFLYERENGLILPFFARYMDSLNKIGLDFSVTTNTNISAGIVYNENLIFISCGLIDRLNKLAELIYSSGVLDDVKKPIRYYDLHFTHDPFKGFNQDDNTFGSDHKDHLYLFIFDILLLFIVNHEVGHFYNEHGARLNTSIFDDVENHRKIKTQEIIPSHARELVADIYAFHLTIKYVDVVLVNQKNSLSSLSNKFKEENGSIFLTLVLITCYFQLMDGVGTSDHFNSTHPDSIARAFFIMAAYEPHINNSNSFQFEKIYPEVMALLQQVFGYCDENFKIDWNNRINTPEMEKWYNSICKEYSLWVK